MSREHWLAIRAGLGVKVVFEVAVPAPPVALAAQILRDGSACSFGVLHTGTDHRDYDIPSGTLLDLAVQDVRHLRFTEVRGAREVCLCDARGLLKTFSLTQNRASAPWAVPEPARAMPPPASGVRCRPPLSPSFRLPAWRFTLVFRIFPVTASDRSAILHRRTHERFRPRDRCPRHDLAHPRATDPQWRSGGASPARLHRDRVARRMVSQADPPHSSCRRAPSDPGRLDWC